MTRPPFPNIKGFGSVHGVPSLPPGFIDVFESYRVPTGEIELHAVIGGEGRRCCSSGAGRRAGTSGVT